MKRIISMIVLAFLFATNANSQCGYDNIYYFSPAAPTVVGTPTVLTSCQYGGEYITVTGLVAGATYRFETCGDTDFDTQLTIYAAGGGPSLAYNDDFCGTQSSIDFVAPAAGNYDILVDEFFCTSNSICMTVTATLIALPVVNIDNCAQAQMITCGGTFTGSTATSTIDGPANDCGGGSVAADNWYTIIGTGSDITASLCDGGTTYDSQLDIYTGTCGSLTSVACNDDFCGLQSQITWATTAGTTYYIRVHGFAGQTGAYSLVVNSVTNDDCINATTITPGTYTGATVCATADVAPTCTTGDGTGGGVWYAVTGTNNCASFTASLCGGTTYDSKIRVFEGTCGALTCVVGNDDFCGLQSEVTWNYTPGTTYYILVHGFGTATGAFTLNLTEQTDNVAPVADVATLADVTAECEVTSLTAPTANDACVGAVTGTTATVLPITTQGTTVVTWTYDDGNGNTSTQTQNVIIDDVTGPLADVATLADVTAECEVASLTAPTATDNCAGMVMVSHDATLPITAQGTTVVTWTYEDMNGNTSTQTQNVVIEDVTGPVADVATLTDVTAECEVTSLTEPTATDNCGGAVTVSNDAVLPITTQGTTVVTWTYEDENGNTTTQTQNVVIEDVTGPVADVATLADVTAECEVTSLTDPTATDNCGGAVTVSNDAVLPISTQGTTVVTWTYEDENGNTTTQTQNVVIEDVTAPVADVATLADVTATCEVTSLTDPTATDNCGGTVTVSNDAVFPITADATVTWTYEDENGNTTTQTQEVLISAVDATVTVSGATITANNTNVGVTYQWVDCDNSNAPIAGADEASFTATANGNYAVEVTENGCTETSDCNMIDLSNVNELTADMIKVYPNPASSVLNIETATEGTVGFYDVSGKLILTQNVIAGSNEMNVDQLATGTYTLRLTTANGIQTVRLVIKK